MITKSMQHLHSELLFGKDYDFINIENTYKLSILNKEIEQPTQAELETAWAEVLKEQEAIEIKTEKREAILAIASETDQINLLAEVLNTITSETPDLELIEKAKTTFNEIKTILNN